jgi:hypothetical protein
VTRIVSLSQRKQNVRLDGPDPIAQRGRGGCCHISTLPPSERHVWQEYDLTVHTAQSANGIDGKNGERQGAEKQICAKLPAAVAGTHLAVQHPAEHCQLDRCPGYADRRLGEAGDDSDRSKAEQSAEQRHDLADLDRRCPRDQLATPLVRGHRPAAIGPCARRCRPARLTRPIRSRSGRRARRRVAGRRA